MVKCVLGRGRAINKAPLHGRHTHSLRVTPEKCRSTTNEKSMRNQCLTRRQHTLPQQHSDTEHQICETHHTQPSSKTDETLTTAKHTPKQGTAPADLTVSLTCRHLLVSAVHKVVRQPSLNVHISCQVVHSTSLLHTQTLHQSGKRKISHIAVQQQVSQIEPKGAVAVEIESTGANGR